jgi:NAD(P)-dependent dehydrogenase (short-subunit alcohol dehydrogenase family)
MLSDDPRKRYPTPPYPEPKEGPADADSEMPLRADHGESSYKGQGKLKGRVALITGGDSGIGRAVAVAFAREGADILVSYLSHDEDAKDTARLVENEGQRCLTIGGDIGQEKHCNDLVDRCVSKLGRLDILVNNAAYQQVKDDLQDFTSEDIDRTFKTNIYSMFYLCKAAPTASPARQRNNQCDIRASLSAQPYSTRLRDHQRRHRKLH